MISIPFHGSKRTSYKYVKPIVEKYGYTSVYEPFGGSGVLSVNLYTEGLVERAVINDYDRFFDDYEQYLDYKDWIVKNCEEHGIKKVQGSKTLSMKDRKYLQSLVKTIPKKYWRYLATGYNFCFSGTAQHEKINISDFAYFTRDLTTVKQRKYLNHLNEIELNSCDYKEFLKTYEKEFNEKTLLIVDPPYFSTLQGLYKGKFTKEDTQELINILKELKIDFLFFNDSKETVYELLNGLNIKTETDISSTGCCNKSGKLRKEYFALVQF